MQKMNKNKKENIYNLKEYTDKYKNNENQQFKYSTENRNYLNNSNKKLYLYNSKSLDKDSLRCLMKNKESSQNYNLINDLDINIPLKNNASLKISQVKYSSPIKKGPFDKDKLT